ncbi:MAG: ABC transporter ATP-binding protein [bacterium]
MPSPPHTMPGAPALELSDLVSCYRIGLLQRKREVLHGVNLTLERGKCLGLVGPNGSGKSTLLQILAGVQRPERGVVRVLGEDPRKALARTRLAYLPEDSPFPAELSALVALDLLGALAGLPRKELRSRAERLLERVGLADQRLAPLRTFSRGMMRRFGLAQAFLSEPEVVLLDEPTAGLDAPGFAVLEDLISEARNRGASLVLASHLPSDLLQHCDDLALLLNGHLRAHGPTDELLAIKGRVQLELEGMGPAPLQELEDWVREAGGKVRSSLPSGRSLLELYGQTETHA